MTRIVDRIRHPFSDTRLALRVSVILLVSAGFIVVGTPAWAYWTTQGAGTGGATTGTLNPATSPIASNASGSSTVGVSWTASAGPTTPAGYYVTRIKSDNTTAFACGSTVTTFVTSPCADSVVSDATFHYTVTAVYHSWTATSVASNSVAVASASKLAFTTSPSSNGISGTAFSTQPVVTVQDIGGSTVRTDASTVTLTLAGPAGASLACTTNPKAAVAGVVSFAGCQIDKVGTYTLTATDGSLSPATSSVTITAGAAAAVASQAGSPQLATVNTAFGTSLAAKVTDSFGNVVPGVSVMFTAPSTGASGKFANATVTTSATTDGSGIATATGFTANTTAGSYTVLAAAGSLSASFALTNNPGAATKLVFTTPAVSGPKTPSGPTANVGPITVQRQDVFGNPVIAGTTTLGLASNSTTSSGTPVFSVNSGGTATTTVNITNGVSIVTFWYGDKKAGNYTITVSGLGTVTQTVTITV